MADAETLHIADIAAIEELDPSLTDGSTIIYDREVPVEVRNQIGEDPVRQGTVESIKVKLLLLGAEQEPSLIRVELSSEADLFFHYVHVIDESAFRRVQEQQKLMIQFADYANVLIRMLNACIRETTTNLAIFLMHGDSDARLDFIQNMEYKFVELMSCVFERSPDEVVQHHITYRYNAMKQKLAIMQTRLHELNTLVKTKNPSLLLQLQKHATGGSSSNGGAGSSSGSASSVGPNSSSPQGGGNKSFSVAGSVWR